jgi:hypothetical protein
MPTQLLKKRYFPRFTLPIQSCHHRDLNAGSGGLEWEGQNAWQLPTTSPPGVATPARNRRRRRNVQVEGSLCRGRISSVGHQVWHAQDQLRSMLPLQ